MFAASTLKHTDRLFAAAAVIEAKQQAGWIARQLVRTDLTSEELRVYGIAYRAAVAWVRELRS